MAKEPEFPLQISFRDIEPSPAIEALVRRNAAKLGRFHQRITSCGVVIAAPAHQHHRERLYLIHINIAAPGGTIWINRDRDLNVAHTDVHVAIRDAFAAAVRRLEDFVRRQNGQLKRHAMEPHGVVSLLHREEGYGFIETAAGDEVYFTRNSVLRGAFRRLRAGSKVRFVTAPRTRGRTQQASTVRIIGKHNLVERR